jgi:hypothetical protein
MYFPYDLFQKSSIKMCLSILSNMKNMVCHKLKTLKLNPFGSHVYEYSHKYLNFAQGICTFSTQTHITSNKICK